MKKWAVIISAVLLPFLLVSCSGTPSYERALAKMLDALAGGNVKTAQKYTVDKSLNIKRNSKSASKIYLPLFSSIRYTINGSEKQGDYAEISVTVVAMDMKALMEETSVEAVQNVLTSSGWWHRERFYALMMDKIEAGYSETMTFEATAVMIRKNGGWKVDMANSGTFADAITGGASELIGY